MYISEDFFETRRRVYKCENHFQRDIVSKVDLTDYVFIPFPSLILPRNKNYNRESALSYQFHLALATCK